MADATAGERTCFHHPDRETGRTCTRCDRPACSDCLTPAPVGAHCWQCIKAARPPARQRLRSWNAGKNILATQILVAVNVAVFFIGLAVGARAVAGGGSSLFTEAGRVHQDYALFGPSVAAGEWYRLLTSGFLHYGIIHLGLNMAALYSLGQLLEPELGRLRFVTLYMACLLAGSLGALLLSPHALTAGASGAIFGLFGAAAAGMRLRGYSVWRTPVGSLILFNLVFTFVVPGISIGGHLGGFVAGLFLGTVMLREPISRAAVLRGVVVAVVVAVLAVGVSVWWADGIEPARSGGSALAAQPPRMAPSEPYSYAIPSSSALRMASGRPLTPSLR
ncbi:MAG TPA: rhomboid family intramembrane serine protease [Acidimicrobiales bacterium]|nr:rhomboid family intramembrane serine protease [Acidimicrobiales bacterium]